MSTIAVLTRSMEFNRQRTISVLDRIEKANDPTALLAWQPGPGRAHVAWQLMHIAVTEAIFASDRLAPDKEGKLTDLWTRFRGGSTPDDDIPSVSAIRNALDVGRHELRETLANFTDHDLGLIPKALAERKLTLLDVLHIVNWHEGHHQGQAHLTLNLFDEQNA